ncbi:hypothetical protein J2T55_001415 [Methylohalomonas lacus]|uniref:Uncharacterized protein n=2 Tax=Methylohalomonas lacus TaxID=398773 RepID=A0AAE3HJ94_9GAMM|nr:hypothetical protein [Methylohalomonas lacus]
MMSEKTHDSLITGLDVRHYFQDSVQTAVRNQQLEVRDDTLVYVINLLTDFTRSDMLYEDTPDGRMIKPLVRFYSEAVSASSWQEANESLKRLGDVALFIAGLFANSLQRSLVDVDYYIAMGGSAYDSLAESMRRSFHGRNFSDVYRELGEKFTGLVDVLGEVADEFQPGNDQDLLRLYEIWVLTNSPQAERKLRQHGIQPVATSAGKTSH